MSDIKFTDELKERVLYLSSFGIPGQEIANTIGISSKSTVNNLIRIAKAVEENRIEEAKQISISCHCPANFDWAMKKYGKKLPEPKPKEEPKGSPAELMSIKNIITDAIQENCKVAKIEQIDKDQMGRIMYALARIDERLEAIEQTAAKLQEESNINADNLYKLVTDFKNGITMEVRKRRS